MHLQKPRPLAGAFCQGRALTIFAPAKLKIPMTIHREGHRLLLGLFLLFFVLGLALNLFLPPATYKPTVIALSLGAYFAFFLVILQFFRMPTKNTPFNEDHIIAPADGKVVVIEEVEETEYFHDRRLQISIFMSPINVHSNHNPISGLVSYFRYHPGKYLVAWHPKASSENERTTYVIRNENGVEVLSRQIAGALARRICWYVKEGDAVKQGGEFGFIKFGSRVDIFLPLGTEVTCALGDVTTGAETVIAKLNK